MPNLNMSSVSSGHHPDMQTSVASVPANKVLLDNISNVYNYKDIIQFPMSFLRKYENIIKANLQDYKIDKSRFYRPEYISWDLYGTTDLWYLILFVNDLKSPMELDFEDIKVPNSLYIMEIMNKLKTIDRVKSTHKDPIYIYQSLLKDINSPSEKIVQDDNTFVPDPSITWEDSIDEFKNTFFKIDFGKITRDRYYLDTKLPYREIYKESSVNFGFISDFEKDKVLSPFTNSKMHMYKTLKSNTKYYILKRYAGLMNLTIKSNDDSFKYVYNKKVFENEKVEMTPTILTYDLREATLAPEYLQENLILNYEDKVYEPEVITNADGEECYGIVIDGVKYEIFFDGTAYYIVLEENKKKNEKVVALLENKDYDAKGNQLNTYHSMNEWVFNDPKSNLVKPLIKLDDDIESSYLYFNEEYYYKHGEYVYSMKYDNDSLATGNNITYRIDINRDLKTNNNKLTRYQFLGFEFEVGFSYSKNDINDLKKILNFSPLSITIVTNNLDKDGNNIKYTYSYPYGIQPKYYHYDSITESNNDEIINTIDNFNSCYIDMKNNLYKYKNENNEEIIDNYQIDMYKYKRIIPIINNFEDKELLDIKEILVSPLVERISDDEFEGEVIVSCGKLKIYGLKYDDLVYEYMTPEHTKEYADYIINYNYTTVGTKYENDTSYFEPYIFEENSDILNMLTDESNLDYIIKNNFLLDSKEQPVFECDSEEERSPFDYDKSVYSFYLNSIPGFTPSGENFNSLIYSNDYFKYKLYKAFLNSEGREVKLFSLADMYILDLKLSTTFGDNDYYTTRQYSGYLLNNDTFEDSIVFLNGFNKNNDKNQCIINPLKNIFHQNLQLQFDMISDDNYYFINFGEINYYTNLSPTKKETNEFKYRNNNLYLKNFNSYPFTVDTKDNGDYTNIYYEKFRRFYFEGYGTENNKKKSIINLKLNNTVYSLPEGLYKVISNEGSDIYRPYKYIDDFFIKGYPIKQNKTFINHYKEYIQSVPELTFNHTNPLYKSFKFKDKYEIYIRIKKVHSTYYIYYKYKLEDKFEILYRFNDFYKILNNGTLGFKFFNTIPYNQLTVLDYKIGKIKK